MFPSHDLSKARFEIRKSVLKKDPSVNEKLVDSIPDFKIKVK